METDSVLYPDEKRMHIMNIHPWQRFKWLCAGFTTRLGGESTGAYSSLNVGLHVHDNPHTVVKNRQRIAHLLQQPLSNWTLGEQVHGNEIHEVKSVDRGKGAQILTDAIRGVDGIYTAQPNIMLGVLFADCVPLFFLSPKHKMIGIAHAGWRGTVGRIGPKMVRLWLKKQISLCDIHVVIGPAIGACCYEVGNDVAEYIQQLPGHIGSKALSANSNGKYLLDLKQVNRDLLVDAGIHAANIDWSNWCTCCQTRLFFSHRRDGPYTGRMMAFMALQEGGAS